jgi:hypothetical protein
MTTTAAAAAAAAAAACSAPLSICSAGHHPYGGHEPSPAPVHAQCDHHGHECSSNTAEVGHRTARATHTEAGAFGGGDMCLLCVFERGREWRAGLWVIAACYVTQGGPKDLFCGLFLRFNLMFR